MAAKRSKPTDQVTESEGPPELARLPAGRHGLPREFIAHNQRERLIAGLAIAVAEHGFAKATVDHITKAAAVSRRTFYENFKSKEDCFLAAYDLVSEQVREQVAAAIEENEEWPDQVRAALATLLRFLASEPELARLCMVEQLVAGPDVSYRYRESMDGFVPLLRLGRERQNAGELPETTEEALVGGIASLIARRVNAGRARELEELLPGLVEFALTPYLGSAEAERIAAAQAGDTGSASTTRS